MIGFVILMLALIIVPDKTRKYLLIFFITLVITIYLIQLYRPDIITGFPSEKARWTDSIVTAVYCSALFFLIIQFLLRNYTVERRRAEENEKKFRALSENSQDRITRYDRQHRYTYINKAGLDVIGGNSANALGKTPGEIGLYDKEQSEMLDSAIEKVFTSSQSLVAQYSLKILDGKAYYDIRLFPEFNDKNEVISVLGVSRDITLIKETELKLLQLNADKDLFISILAHDLRNPFNSILGLSSMLLEDIQTMDRFTVEKYIEMINNISRKTFDLLEDLLLWKKSQSGKLEFKPRQTDFVKTCNETLEAMRANAQLKKISVSWATEGNVIIQADEDMLKVVLRNLVSNAIKFTNPGGHIFINRELTPSLLTVTVSDNGVGIAADRINNLFDISKIATTPGTENEKGTGLGLLLCKEFVEKHGGRIWVESIEGKGSDFKFTIPVGQSEN
jgi:PAS domain S-box-containing protein